MAELYSPLRYPGGKARLAPLLLHFIESLKLDVPRYVEPYAGGAGAALQLLIEEFVESIWINDADPRIWAFWKCILEYPEDLVRRIESVDLTVREWRRQKSIYEAGDAGPLLDLGFSVFFLNRTTRSGILHNGGPIGGYEQTGPYKIDARFNRDGLIRRILRIAAYADRIRLSNLDGMEVLQSIDADPVEAGRTIAYIDPPYYDKGADLYMNNFDHKQHRALAEYLSGDRRFKWLATYDNVFDIGHLYRKFKTYTFNLSYSAYERREGQEVLILQKGTPIPPDLTEILAGIGRPQVPQLMP